MKQKVIGGPGKETLITKTGRVLDVTGWDPANLCEQCALIASEARPCAAVDVPPKRVKTARFIIKDFGLHWTETALESVSLFHIYKFPHLEWVLTKIEETESFSPWQIWLEGHLYGYSEHAIAEYLKALKKEKENGARPSSSRKIKP